MNLENKIESLLFIKTEGVSISYLASKLGATEKEISEALTRLGEQYRGRGITVVRSQDQAMFATSKEASTLLSELFDEEETKELSVASLQTLSIILYKGSATRGEISYIRGVDSRMSVRNLVIRGLIQKTGNDSFTATLDALRHLGISQIEDLPRWKEVHERLTESTQKKAHE